MSFLEGDTYFRKTCRGSGEKLSHCETGGNRCIYTGNDHVNEPKATYRVAGPRRSADRVGRWQPAVADHVHLVSAAWGQLGGTGGLPQIWALGDAEVCIFGNGRLLCQLRHNEEITCK